MKVLALDTALAGCSTALYSAPDGACACERQAMARGQAEELVPMVQRVMDKAGTDFNALDLIVTTVGPGAFTGLRIGIAAAQGFGLATGKPVVGVTTTDALAAMFFRENRLEPGQVLCVLIETKREDYYCQFYKADGMADTEPLALPAGGVREMAAGRDVIYIGDATARFAQAGDKARKGFELPDPCIIAAKGLALHESGKGRAAEPLYLRDADVSKSSKEQRQILDSGF